MNKLSAFFLFTLLLSACTPAPPLPPATGPSATVAPATQTAAPLQEKVSLGYYTGSDASLAAVKNFADSINTVSADVFGVTPEGKIDGTDPLELLSFAKEHGIATYLCISNYNSSAQVNDFDPFLAEAAIVTHKTEFIPALVSQAKSGGYSGVNIDFESIAFSADLESDRAAFTTFIHDLALALHTEGLKLIISVPAKTTDNPADSWSYPFDLASLGQDVDYLQLMTYDAHGPWSEPGPISGADWVEEVVGYSSMLVDPAKLLIGLPAYGYDWRSDGSTTDVSWVDFPALLTKPGVETGVEATSLSPWLTYTEKGLSHTVWYENADSLRAKAALVERYSLGGLSMWALGKEDAAFWQAVQTQ